MRLLRMRLLRSGITAALIGFLAIFAFSAASASASAPGAGWSIGSVAEPTNFQSGDEGHDRYTVTAVNVGARATADTVTVTDQLPAGLVVTEAVLKESGGEAREGTCEVAAGVVTCTFENPVRAGVELLLTVDVEVEPAAPAGVQPNIVRVFDGEAGESSTSEPTAINEGPAAFGIEQFAFDALGVNGRGDVQSADHPFASTTRIVLNTRLVKSGGAGKVDRVVQAPRDVVVELPLGFVGDPLAAERCPVVEMTDVVGSIGGGDLRTACPDGSIVGAVRLVWEGGVHTEQQGYREAPGYPLYNLVPAHGYPAELGFNAGIGQPAFMYATVVPSPSGYRLRISSPGTLNVKGVEQVVFTVYGNPAEHDGTSGNEAFMANPSGCTAGPVKAKIEVSGWEGGFEGKEATAYPDMTGCNLLQGAVFSPLISVEPTNGEPEAGSAGKPMGYEVNLKLPQAENALGVLATPDLRDATVSLPQGVVLSPSSANGLQACPATGPEGINIEGPGTEGNVLKDPEATEVGEGHPGGNSSPYDDTLMHAAPGHCPAASTLGTVEVRTPLLEGPLTGHVYLGEPACSPCSGADAEDGKLVKLYIEVNDPTAGVIVKLPGVTTINQATGQLSGTFKENPQMPFEDFKLTFKSGPRAALVNPQACGTYTSTGDLMPWSAPESGPDATPSSDLTIDEGCAPQGFAPSFSAGTMNNQAGGYGPLIMSFSRNDSEQDFLGLSEILPEGLLAKLAGVPRCGEAEANGGTCPEGSQIGTVTTGAGPGPDPYYVTGKVYLTGPYNGGPFGEVVQVPAVAGPFNLGTVVVRGSIRVNPTTAQASIVSNPFPTTLDGIPLQIKTVSVNVNRQGFTFNPTNCTPSSINATLTSEQGSAVPVSSPFDAVSCAALPFKPDLTASVSGKTSKQNGASLVVRVVARSGEANVSRTDLQLPLALPARLTTLQKACTEAQFDANPAGCPEASDIGMASVRTPLLNVSLTGPAYIVSHGGAAFPDVEFVLQGEGVEIVLDGKTDIKKGITYSNFETIPDAPFSSFEATLPEGPHSILTANGSLCAPTKTVTVKKRVAVRRKGRRTVHVLRSVSQQVAESLVIPTTLVGQNGAVIKQTTKVSVTGCPKAKKAAKKKVKKKAKAHGKKGKGKK
jgi:uncharacterized repeat protein (TIGR01451 family)